MRMTAAAFLYGAVLLSAQAGAAPAIPSCAETPAFSALDFWVGEWDVFAGGREVGENRVEKVLDGCAILEHWTSRAGGEGKSLFYYHPAERRWKQVWVTSRSLAPGGTKEKSQVEAPAGSLRFQGEMILPDGREYLDRTTLTPLGKGEVRQLIEYSADGGKTWQVSFDAVYRTRQEARDGQDAGAS